MDGQDGQTDRALIVSEISAFISAFIPTDRQVPRSQSSSGRTDRRTWPDRLDVPIDRRTLNGKIDSSSDADQEYIYFIGSGKLYDIVVRFADQ